MRARIIYCLILVVSLSITYIFNSDASRELFLLVLVLPIISLLYTLSAHAFLTVAFLSPFIKVERGNRFNFQLLVSNNSFLIFPFVEFIAISDEGVKTLVKNGVRASLDSKEKVRISFPCEAVSRGMHSIHIKKIYVVDFLGIFKIPLSLKDIKECKVLIMPKLIRRTFNINPKSNSFDQMNQKTKADINEYTKTQGNDAGGELRGFQQGDSLRKIHWKLYAKTNNWLVRTGEDITLGKHMIALNPVINTTNSTMKNNTKTITEGEETLIECFLSVADNIFSKGNPLKLWLYDKENTRWNFFKITSIHDISALQELLAEYLFIDSHNNTNSKLLQGISTDKNSIANNISVMEGYFDGKIMLDGKVV